VKSIIEKLAYGFCSTEVKMLIDKLEENPRSMPLSSDSYPSHSYATIANDGSYSFRDRVAIATAVRRIRQQATKMRIVELIFEGEEKQRQYIPGETITQRMTSPTSMITAEGLTKQALKILESEMAKNYKNPTQTAEAIRQKGLL
jgi:hypothetical protein